MQEIKCFFINLIRIDVEISYSVYKECQYIFLQPYLNKYKFQRLNKQV